MKTSVLYISYDGILEPLGQSQVLSYLLNLANNYNITIVSYEKPEDYKKKAPRIALEDKLKKSGIKWCPLRYHKAPSGLATAYDIIRGIFVASWLIYRHKIQIIHARSYVSSVIALVTKKLFNVSFIFDMRGFWADERIDGNIWVKYSRLYHIAKGFEKHFLLNADSVVSLTHAAVNTMRDFPYLQGKDIDFHVITTCTDLELFDYQCFPAHTKWPDNDTFTLGYVGSAGVWYLFDETLLFFKQLLKTIPQAYLQIINKGEHEYILERLDFHNIPKDCVNIQSASREQVAESMAKMDAGIFFIKPAFSKTASAPTKLGEFLGCGVPCISNSGVGDMATILQDNRVGVALNGFSFDTMQTGLSRLLELCQTQDIKSRCRNTAQENFSLEKGVQQYHDIYNKLSSTTN
jgi:glycosyltransferase involved in cell wall biosynthesis